MVSPIEELATGEFQEVIDDTIQPKGVKKLVFCMGKFYYDLLAEREILEREDVALVRIEQLFPLHLEKLQQVIDRYPNVTELYLGTRRTKKHGGLEFSARTFRYGKIKCTFS